MYDTTEEAQQKLAGSVVFFANTPVYIYKVTLKNKTPYLGFKPLPFDDKEDYHWESIENPSWNFRNLGSKLGYTDVLFNNWCVFHTSRIPIRHSRQGLDDKTVKVSYEFDKPSPVNWNGLLAKPELVSTLKGIFRPSKVVFKELIDSNGEILSRTLSRRLMLSYDRVSPPVLSYRGSRVAYTEDGEIFKLAPHKTFLREELEDVENLKIA